MYMTAGSKVEEMYKQEQQLHFVTIIPLEEPLERCCDGLGFVEGPGRRSDASRIRMSLDITNLSERDIVYESAAAA